MTFDSRAVGACSNSGDLHSTASVYEHRLLDGIVRLANPQQYPSEAANLADPRGRGHFTQGVEDSYLRPFNTGRMNINSNCCNGLELPKGLHVSFSF